MVTTQPTNLAADLRIAVARTARRLRQEGSGLSATTGAALATIERHGPLTPSELAARERIQRPTATRLIGRLEEDGLIVRTPDPIDKPPPDIKPIPPPNNSGLARAISTSIRFVPLP